MFGIVDVRADIDACDMCCKACLNTIRESALWEKNILLHWGIEPVPVLHLAFQSDCKNINSEQGYCFVVVVGCLSFPHAATWIRFLWDMPPEPDYSEKARVYLDMLPEPPNRLLRKS